MTYITNESVEGLPLSDAVIAGDFIYVSGMCAFGDDGKIISGGVAAETRCIFKDLKRILERCNASFDNIAKVNIHLVNESDFDAFNIAYQEFFPGNKPARITVCSGMTINALIEMDFIAYTGK